MDPWQNSTKVFSTGSCRSARREEGSRFGCPGDASAKEKSVVWQPVLTEASNKTILGQSCHTRRHARLQIIQSTLTWHLIHCSKPGEKQNHTARRWKKECFPSSLLDDPGCLVCDRMLGLAGRSGCNQCAGMPLDLQYRAYARMRSISSTLSWS